MYYQQQGSIIVDNSFKREFETRRREFETRKKDLCHQLAIKLTHCDFRNTEIINKYNRQYMSLLDSCICEKDLLLIEKTLFEST